MAADTYDSILGIILQGTGNNNNSWGDTFNNNASKPIARAIAGMNIIGSTGGAVDLSGTLPPAGMRQDIDAIQLANGALASDLTITVVNLSKTWRFWNRTTGGFNVYVKVPGGVAASGPSSPGGLVQIPNGVCVSVICDGAGTLLRTDDADIGAFRASGKVAVGPGEIACNGASYLKTAFPDLYAKIGTTWGSADGLHFTVPNLTDTGRVLRSATGAVTAGTYQANQNQSHVHTVTGAPSVGTLSTDTQGSHSHSTNVSDPSHTHTLAQTVVVNGSGGGIGGGGSFGLPIGSAINASFTGIGVSINAAGAHSHNVTGAPGIGSLGTASQGGTEARPESAVCTIAIRY